MAPLERLLLAAACCTHERRLAKQDRLVVFEPRFAHDVSRVYPTATAATRTFTHAKQLQSHLLRFGRAITGRNKRTIGSSVPKSLATKVFEPSSRPNALSIRREGGVQDQLAQVDESVVGPPEANRSNKFQSELQSGSFENHKWK